MKTVMALLLITCPAMGQVDTVSWDDTPYDVLCFAFKSDTTRFDWILYVQDGIVHADSGFKVESGNGSEQIIGYFISDPMVRWFLWKWKPNRKCLCRIELLPEEIVGLNPPRGRRSAP